MCHVTVAEFGERERERAMYTGRASKTTRKELDRGEIEFHIMSLINIDK